MTERADAKEKTVGAKIEGVVAVNGPAVPDKKTAIVTMATALSAGIVKWFEISTGINIPIYGEVFLLSLFVGMASYLTPERLRAGTWMPSLTDVVSIAATAFGSTILKGYESILDANGDVMAELEVMIMPAIVGLATSLVPSKYVKIKETK